MDLEVLADFIENLEFNKVTEFPVELEQHPVHVFPLVAKLVSKDLLPDVEVLLWLTISNIRSLSSEEVVCLFYWRDLINSFWLVCRNSPPFVSCFKVVTFINPALTRVLHREVLARSKLVDWLHVVGWLDPYLAALLGTCHKWNIWLSSWLTVLVVDLVHVAAELNQLLDGQVICWNEFAVEVAPLLFLGYRYRLGVLCLTRYVVIFRMNSWNPFCLLGACFIW